MWLSLQSHYICKKSNCYGVFPYCFSNLFHGHFSVVIGGKLHDSEKAVTNRDRGASLLQRITAQLKSSLREIKRQITQRRREPAWSFSERTDHAALAEQVQRELTGELMAMRRRWMDTEELIANWKTAAERLKPSRRRKSTPSNPEFQF
jgi:hypothetical protein